MNNESITGKWTELKGEVLNMWGKLTHDDLDRSKGNLAALAGIIEQQYGETKEAITDKLHKLFGQGEHELNAKVDEAKNAVADKTEQAKDALRDARSSDEEPSAH